MSMYIQQYFTDYIFLPGALIGVSVVIHTSKSSGFLIKSYTMKQVLLTLALFIVLSATAQVDSFSKEGVMYYTYDARTLPVRTFYPKNGLRLCPFCGRMETETHIKGQKHEHNNWGTMFFGSGYVHYPKVAPIREVKAKYIQK